MLTTARARPRKNASLRQDAAQPWVRRHAAAARASRASSDRDVAAPQDGGNDRRPNASVNQKCAPQNVGSAAPEQPLLGTPDCGALPVPCQNARHANAPPLGLSKLAATEFEGARYHLLQFAVMQELNSTGASGRRVLASSTCSTFAHSRRRPPSSSHYCFETSFGALPGTTRAPGVITRHDTEAQRNRKERHMLRQLGSSTLQTRRWQVTGRGTAW